MTHTHEFSHTVLASKIGAEGFKTSFTADARALELLAKRYNILSVDALSGDAQLNRELDGMTIRVTGTFTAQVTQACVTTLEPVKDEIAETFEGWFLDESQASSFQRAKKRREKAEMHPDDMPFEDDEAPVPDEHEEPEAVIGGMVDVGELVAQYLSLALNPYPHHPKALEAGPVGDEAALERPNPFAVLKDLKTK